MIEMDRKTERNRQKSVHRRAARLDVRVEKSRRRIWGIGNQQGYRISNLDGLPLAGDRWDLPTLDDVTRVLDQIEARLKAENGHNPKSE